MNTGSKLILFFLRYPATPQHLNKNYIVINHIQVFKSGGNITSRNLRFWLAKKMVVQSHRIETLQKADF